ncbi:MAG TPA: hypothetical protein VFG53_11240 [Anaeromyxobacter sp.]|nr:hypothetical protein [Anaeromyxobacter sp.]
MKTPAALIAAALAIVLLSAPALAAEVDRREANQQARIGEGVESGQLTPGETARLEKKEARIHRQVRRDRAENGGTLTPGEKAQVNREQNHASRDIYRAKHNGNHM